MQQTSSMGIDFLIINQGGHPVYHEESSPGAYDAATQVRAVPTERRAAATVTRGTYLTGWV